MMNKYVRFLNLKSITRASLLLCFFVLMQVHGNAQFAVSTNSGSGLAGTYTSLAAAITDLNAATITSPVVITCAAGAETNPAGGYSITATGTSTNTIIIEGAGATSVITTPNPAGTAGNVNDAIFKIIGGDYITIQGFSMNENALNTTTTLASNNMVEWGVALLSASATNGPQNVTLRNNSITLNRTYTNTFGIYSNSSHTSTTISTPLTTAAGGEHNNLVITGNTISNVNQGIVVVGGAAATAQNTGLVIGGVGNGNSITNYGTAPQASTYYLVSGTMNGVLIRNTKTFDVSYNTIASSNTSTLSTIRGIFVTSFSAAPTGTLVQNISNNNISVRSSYTSGALQGILVETMTGNATTTLNIDTNDFNTFGHAVASSGAITFINNSQAVQTCSISNNTFTNMTVNTTGGVTFINNFASAATVNINNNTISSFTYTATSGVFIAISNSGTTGTTLNIGTNTISNITIGSSATHPLIVVGSPGGTANVTTNTIQNIICTATSGTFRCITATTPVGLYSVTGNTIDGISYTSAASTGSIDGIYNFALATLQNWSNNIIRNLSTPTTGTIRGIHNNTSAGTFNFNNNQIYNFSTTAGGAGGATFTGISSVNNSATISGNIIYALNSTGTTGGSGGSINGITTTGTGTSNITFNAIYDLSSNSTNPVVNGINISGGTTNNLNNNLIGDLRATASTGNVTISGILVSGGTTNNLFHNTVNIASTTSSATTFGTSAIYFSSSSPVNNLRNNIFVNTSSPGPTGGFTAAIRYTAAPSSTNFPAANNNNFYYAGTPASNRVLYCEGTTAAPTNGQQTIATYKTYINTTLPVSGRESASVSEVPNFISITGSNPISSFLKYDTGIATQIEQGGVLGTGISTDFSGTTVRCPGGGCPGSTSTPDMGAWELEGISPAPIVNSVSITPTGNQCTNVTRTVTANVTPANPLSTVTLNYSVDGVAQTPINMTGGMVNATSDWTGVIPTVSPANGAVTWSVVATDGTFLGSKTGTGYTDQPLTGVSASISATPSTLCAGGTTNLTASITRPGSSSIGLGASTSSSTAASFFPGAWGGAKTQYIILASELMAQGLSAGDITEIAFEPTTSGQTYQGFFVNIGATAQTAMTTAFITAGLTEVYAGTLANNGFLPVANSINNLVFGTGGTASVFNWNGTSNIVISISWSSVPNAGTSTASTMKVDVPGFTCSAYDQTDNVSPAVEKATLIADGTGTSRPKFTLKGNKAPLMSSYSWTDGTNTVTGNPANLVIATVPATVTLTATDGNGCTLTPTTSISASPALSTLNVSTSANILCGGVTANLTATPVGGCPSYTYVWSASPSLGVTFSNPNISNPTFSAVPSPAIQTMYSLTCTVTDAASNMISDNTIVITVDPKPTASISPSSASICGIGSVTLTASGGGTYAWAANPTLSATNIAAPTATPTATTTYTVTVTNAAGCTATAAQTITVNPPVGTLTTTATPTNICSGGSSNLLVTTPVPSSYCTASATTGCGSGDEYISNVTFGSINNTTACGGTTYSDFTAQSTTVSAGATGLVLTYLNPNGFTGDQFKVYIDWNQDGVFTIGGDEEYTGTGLTTVTFSINVPVGALNGNTRMRVRLTYAGGMAPCGVSAYGEIEDYTINVTGGIGAYTYLWNDPSASTTAATSVTPSATTTYTVTVTSGNGCTNTATATVNVVSAAVTNGNNAGSGSLRAAIDCAAENDVITIDPMVVPTVMLTAPINITKSLTITGATSLEFDFASPNPLNSAAYGINVVAAKTLTLTNINVVDKNNPGAVPPLNIPLITVEGTINSVGVNVTKQ